MNNKHKVYFLFILFISGLFMVPILGESSAMTSESIMIDESVESSIMPREIRVAIYDEPNMTAPAYATSPGGMNNNVTHLASVLENAGYTVDLLDVQDIYNYQLKTADYDVFIMCDNFPRENITDRVIDFWSGGGGILSFDGSSGFLCYFGILPAAAVGTSGQGIYWTYGGNHIVLMERHPVTKSYQGGTINTLSGYLVWDFIALSAATSGDVTKLASNTIDPNEASVVAFDPSTAGGKIVTIAFDLGTEEIPELDDMYVDAVDWLAPRPKGRILFDYTNEPYYGIDDGDPARNGGDQFSTLRDEWVSRTFTLDKLFPDEVATITSDILEKYDMLFINTPLLAYTATEIDAIQSWVEDGGGLFLMSEWSPGFRPESANIREIISGYDLNITDTSYSTQITTNITTSHPINEAVVSLQFEGGNYVESWEPARTLATDVSGNELAVTQEIGNGRVVLFGDINGLSNYIANEDNTQFGFNIANWLCSGGAGILLFTDGKQSLGVNYNFYRSPAALALNELGVNYYMTNERDYFNESLKLQSWDLLIIDSNNMAPVSSHSLIRDHIEAGGRVIWRDFLFKQSQYNSMWNYLGWAGQDGSYTIGPPTVYLWDAGHSVFNLPVGYGADNFTSTVNQFSTDYVNVTLFANATAIAGVSVSPNENATAIILSHGDRVLCNMMAISEYLDDTDDSTYADGYELFINEITFMLRPSVDNPADVEYTEGESGNNIVWAGYGGLPFAYSIEMDTTPVHGDDWDGGAVSYNVDGLTNGTYVFEITLVDDLGRSVSDSVTVTVLPYVAPTNTTTTTTDGGGAPLDPTLILIIAGAAGVVIVIIIIIVMKKK